MKAGGSDRVASLTLNPINMWEDAPFSCNWCFHQQWNEFPKNLSVRHAMCVFLSYYLTAFPESNFVSHLSTQWSVITQIKSTFVGTGNETVLRGIQTFENCARIRGTDKQISNTILSCRNTNKKGWQCRPMHTHFSWTILALESFQSNSVRSNNSCCKHSRPALLHKGTWHWAFTACPESQSWIDFDGEPCGWGSGQEVWNESRVRISGHVACLQLNRDYFTSLVARRNINQCDRRITWISWTDQFGFFVPPTCVPFRLRLDSAWENLQTTVHNLLTAVHNRLCIPLIDQSTLLAQPSFLSVCDWHPVATSENSGFASLPSSAPEWFASSLIRILLSLSSSHPVRNGVRGKLIRTFGTGTLPSPFFRYSCTRAFLF